MESIGDRTLTLDDHTLPRPRADRLPGVRENPVPEKLLGKTYA